MTHIHELPDEPDEEIYDDPKDEDADELICPACSGSGEGRYESTTCYSCRGSGVDRFGRDTA